MTRSVFDGCRSRSAPRGLALLALVAVLGGVTACASDPSSPEPGGAQGPAADQSATSGSLSLALTLPGGLNFQQFTYAITGPNYTKADSIDVSKSHTVSVVVGNLPAGYGYSVTLAGASADPVASCTGAAAFVVTAGAQTSVPVDVVCHVKSSQPVAAAVPIPGSSSVALGFVLLAIGGVAVRRRTRAT
jgi:hypothetical protein